MVEGRPINGVEVRNKKGILLFAKWGTAEPAGRSLSRARADLVQGPGMVDSGHLSAVAKNGQAQTRRDQRKAAADRGARALRLAPWLLVIMARNTPFLS